MRQARASGVKRLQGNLCLSFDVFIRAETQKALTNLLKKSPLKKIIGGGVLRKIKGKVDYAYFPSGSVVAVKPDIMDGWCWLHLRIMGEEANNDYIHKPDDIEPDNWNKSKLRKWFEKNGTLKSIRGVKVYEHVLKNKERVQMWREKEMIANGYSFHTFTK